MPNSILIEELQNLRDAYSQQHKSNTALQAAFKGFQAAQSKTLKALSEYKNSSVEYEQAQNAFSQNGLKETAIDPLMPLLRREDKALASLISTLKQSLAALNSEPVDVVRLAKALEQLQNAPENVQALMPELQNELDIAQKVLGDEFGEKLRDALQAKGLSIGGRSPRFELGRFELEANFAKRSLSLRYGRDLVVPHISVTVEAALKAYESAVKLVQGRHEDGKRWIAQFAEASQNVRLKSKNDTARVNLVDCYIEMTLLRQGRQFNIEPSKRSFSDYSRAQFAYDFYEFTHSQRLSHAGLMVRAHVATKSQAESPAKSFWIVEGDSPYDGRYIGDIEWEKS
jgi:hypothetical protein